MVVEKYYCDVCNKEILTNGGGKVITIKELPTICLNERYKVYHMCNDCAFEVVESVNEMIKEVM